MNFSHDTELTLRAAGALVTSNRVHDADDLADQRALDAYLREWGWTGRRDRDADELAARLADVLDDDALVARLRDAGPAQARRFSWARAGQETADVYDRALAGSAGGRR